MSSVASRTRCLVAHLLSPVVTGCHLLQAALLHDTVEDTDTSLAELEAKFGPVVARIVQEVTDDKSLPKQERKRQQVEHAPHCSHQAKLVKLADKLYNLRDLNRCMPVGEPLLLRPSPFTTSFNLSRRICLV